MSSGQLMQKPSMPRRFWELMRLLMLALDPRKNEAPRIYEILSTHNNLAEKSLYLNMGYWKHAKTYDEACEALAQELGHYGQLAAGDKVLDAGCGFGDQDRYFLQTFRPQHIVGLNITEFQLQVAAERHPLKEISWVYGSATQMPFDEAAFDKIVALESGFHFVARVDFFREALRVLRPGGTLALADVVVSGAKRTFVERVMDAIGHRMWQAPSENLVTLETYCRQLGEAGFVDVECRDISADVYQPFEQFARLRVREPEVRRRLNPLLRMAWTAPRDAMSGTRYVLVRARKPL